MNRPLTWVGFVIMVMAALAGFIPNLFSIILLFVTTLLGGHYIRKNESKEVYDRFIDIFGYSVCGFNLIVAGMIMLTPLDYVDKASGAFLNIMVAIVIFTLISNRKTA